MAFSIPTALCISVPKLVCACSLYFVPLCRAVLCYVVLFQDHGSRMSSDACVRGSNPFGALVLDTKSRLCAKAQLGNSATPHGSLGVVQVVHPTSAFARPLHGSSDLETHIDSASHSRFLASTLATQSIAHCAAEKLRPSQSVLISAIAYQISPDFFTTTIKLRPGITLQQRLLERGPRAHLQPFRLTGVSHLHDSIASILQAERLTRRH